MYDFHQSEVFFEVDPGTLSSALLNILENSIDACVDDKSNVKKFKVILDVIVNKDHVTFKAIDNGVGMDRQMLENLFTLFFYSKGNRGTGLGLFISNQIVEQHGGTIEVDTKPGEFTEFRIILPRTAASLAKSGGRA